MQLIECTDYKIVVFGSDVAIDELGKLSSDNTIFVPLNGCDDDDFPHERSLVKNSKASFLNHMMWEGLLDDLEQLDYIKNCCDRFYNTGKQMLIEDYAFQQDEPFYDYSR